MGYNPTVNDGTGIRRKTILSPESIRCRTRIPLGAGHAKGARANSRRSVSAGTRCLSCDLQATKYGELHQIQNKGNYDGAGKHAAQYRERQWRHQPAASSQRQGDDQIGDGR